MRLFGEQFQLGVLRDPITAIVGGASAGISAIGGIFKSNTANKAASAQQAAANAAGQEQIDAANKVNPDILSTAATQGQNVQNTASDQAVYANKIAQNAGTQAVDAAGNASAELDPYVAAGNTAAGALNSGIAPGGDFNKTPTMADLQIDPGYAFRLQQGQEALTRAAAANGGVGGGGFAKDLNNYVQGSASQEYQNAFNRFETSTQNRFANVNAVANAGASAAEYGGTLRTNANEYAGNIQSNAAQFGAGLNTGAAQFAAGNNINATDLASQNTINAASQDANYRTQGANAKAAGQVAGSNAMWGGFGAAANTALGTYMYSRPSANYIQRPPGYQMPSNPGYNGYPGGTA